MRALAGTYRRRIVWLPVLGPAVSTAPYELAVAALDCELAVGDDDLAADDRLDRPAGGLEALVGIEVRAGLHPRALDLHRPFRVDDGEVGVGADRERSLVRPQTEQLRRGGRDQRYEAAQAQPSGSHAFREEHPDETLDIRDAPGHAREVERGIRLLLERPGRVVGGVRLDLSVRDRPPQRLLVLRPTQRRPGDELARLAAGQAVAPLVEEEVDRPGLDVDLRTAPARAPHRLERLQRGQVNEVDRAVQSAAVNADLLRRQALGDVRPRDRESVHLPPALRKEDTRQVVDQRAVLSVDVDEDARL